MELTDAVEKKITLAVRAGVSPYVAARYAGVSRTTFWRWRLLRRSFRKALGQAEAETEVRRIAALTLKAHIAITEWLKERGLEETANNVYDAMRALKDRDLHALAKAVVLKEQAASMIEEAKRLEETCVTTTGQGRQKRQR